MNYIEEIKDTLDYLETRLEQLNEFGSDEYHKINNCRIAVEEIEKLLKPSGSTKLSIPDVGQSFGCEFRFCSAVIDKHNNMRCDKCNKYLKNIAPKC